MWIYAKDHNEEIVRSPKAFEFSFEDKKHFYHVDFQYKEKYIRLKGDQFFEDDKMINPFDKKFDDLAEAKHQCGFQNKVEFWTRKDI